MVHRPRLGRRGVLCALVAAPLVVACNREGGGPPRCKTCGMKLDPKSAWHAELASGGQVVAFDTPKCAFTAWRSGKVKAESMRVREYYDAKGPLRDAAGLRFVVGGDVLGPMGADLVPVDPERAAQFVRDHGAAQAYAADEVTTEVLGKLR